MLLQRLGELGGARLHFLEQARILDRDDGLVGEGLEDGNLLLGEWPHLRPANDDCADRNVLPQQGRGEKRSVALP